MTEAQHLADRADGVHTTSEVCLSLRGMREELLTPGGALPMQEVCT
jgi:hypothetical protein